MPISRYTSGRPSPREDDLHDVAAHLVGDSVRELARRLRTERSLNPAHPATISRELEHDLRYPGVILEDLLDLLEERDGALVVQNLPEADDERRRFPYRRGIGRKGC